MGGIAVNGSCGSEGTGRVASLFPPGNGVDEWEGGIIDFVGAWDRNRTGTVEIYRGILSPLRLPLPPPRQWQDCLRILKGSQGQKRRSAFSYQPSALSNQELTEKSQETTQGEAAGFRLSPE